VPASECETAADKIKRASLLCRTTLSPDRAILIECALDSAFNSADKTDLEARFERIPECAEKLTDLLCDTAAVAMCLDPEKNSAYVIFKSLNDAVSFILPQMPKNSHRKLIFAHLDSRSAGNMKTKSVNEGESVKNIGALTSDIVKTFDLNGLTPAAIAIGFGHEENSSQSAAIKALLRAAYIHNEDPILAECERRTCGMFNRLGDKRTALYCAIESSYPLRQHFSRGFITVIAADPFVNPVIVTL